MMIVMPKLDGRWVDLDLLVALDVMLDTVSVTRAAAQVGLSQPAMSRALARLRTQFDDRLIERSAGGWRLTPRAGALRDPLKRLLGDAAALYRPSPFDPQTMTREFRCAIPSVAAAVLLPRLRTVLARDAPGCRLIVVPWTLRAERAAEVDLAITSEPELFPGFHQALLYDDCDHLAYRSGDALPTAQHWASRPHVAVVATGYAEDLVDRWLRDQGSSRTIAITVPHYLQALHLVGDSDLLAILPRRLIAALGARIGVASVPLPMPQTPDRQWLLHPPHLNRDPALTWLRNQIQAAFDLSSSD